MATKRRRTGAIATIAIPAAALTASVTLLSGAHAQTPAIAGAELRILSPDPAQSITADSFPLDVSFKSRTKSPVSTAELWVDGVRWVRRDLDAPQTRNVLSFEVDASTLPEGLHTFTIKTISLDGAVSQTELKSQVVRRSPLQEAINTSDNGIGPEMAFKGQLSKGHVAGSIEIAVDAKSRAGVDPYVTFYVDKQFKTLKNYPPYNYVWDTTTVANGYHEIEATGYLDSSNATTTRKMRIFVDNAGGNTVVQKDIPDLSRKSAKATAAATVTPSKAAIKKIASPTKPADAVKAAPVVRVVKTVTPATVAATPAPTIVERSVVTPVAPRVAKPARTAPTPPTAPAVSKTVVTAIVTPAPAVSVAPVAKATIAAPTARIIPAVKSLPITITSGTSIVEMPLVPERALTRTTTAKFASPKPLHPVQTASALVVNRTKFSARAPRPVAALVPLAKTVRTSAKATPRAIVRPHMPSVLDMMHMQGLEGKTFQIAFNGTRIAFDVQPRVEAGLPIAPFRQIFEHTGGQVMWVKDTQVVRAVNANHEIVIKVGQKTATVNGQTLTMDRPATLEKGRTIVPLGFVGKALDVDVKYDAATGHLQITSKH